MKLTVEQASAALQEIADRAAKIDALGLVELNGHGRVNFFVKGYLTIRDLRMILDVLESVE